MSAEKWLRLSYAVLALSLAASFAGWQVFRRSAYAATAQPSVDWRAYNGGVDGDHYSPLLQINRDNVSLLRPAWTFDTGEKGSTQTNPLVVGRVLYGYTPKLKVFALDAATGKRLWLFDSGVESGQPSRGFAYWTDGHERRLFAAVMNFLYALDPDTGKALQRFGENGRIDLRQHLGQQDENYQQRMVVMTTPGVVYKDMLIAGFRTSEESPAPPGDIRAFDVHTGALRWSFHTIPHPGEYGYESWPKDAWKTAGSANNWAGMSLDQARGIVYVPTGSPVSDFYGADRVGDGLFGDSLLALDANTGKRLWHFQAVHHDIWDRDFPSPPALVTVNKDGRQVDAVAQTSKQGFVYLFDRVTGKPLFPIEERPYRASTVPGERTAATQPLPTSPAPYARQRLTADMLTQRTPEAHAQALQQFTELRSGGQFLPFATGAQTVVFPGYDGGAEWGGPAIDPKTGVIYINANDVPWTGVLIENKSVGGPGAEAYKSYCAACHGEERRGSPPAFPSLVGISQRLTEAEIKNTIRNGKGRMPGFENRLSDDDLLYLLSFLQTEGRPDIDTNAGPSKKELEPAGLEQKQARYRFGGYRKLQDADGYPIVEPPWGTLNAIDLNTGKYLWRIPLGEYPELTAQGVKATGTENYGGPVVTAGGVVFIGATMFDDKIRAFDSRSGKQLWEYKLPFAGVATPAVYMVDGTEYLVIAASGGRNPKEPAGSAYVSFALPSSK